MLVATLLLTFAIPQQTETGADLGAQLQRELTRLVDMPSARGRKLAAEALAKKKIASLQQWQAACGSFGDFPALKSGTSKQRVDLQVLGETESTEIHLFVPKGYDPKVATPLLLWGHGASGTGAREYLQWQRTADQIGMFVLAPTEFLREPGWGYTPRERAAQLAALRWARRHANIDENAIFVGGYSRGGHMAWDLALRFPDRWAGVLPCCGGPRLKIGEQNNLRYLENVALLPIRDLQGSRDSPLMLENLHLAFARLKRLKAKDAMLHEFPERGHSYDLSAVDWGEFFTKRRDPAPRRLVRRTADLSEGRTAWAVITGVERNIGVKVAPRVSSAHWAKLDEAGQRALIHDRLVDLTARLAVTNKGKGRFSAQGKGVGSFELLLSSDMIGRKGAVEVRWRSRPVRTTVTPSVGVLLADFGERFDRTFLPVARVVVP